MAVGGPVRWHLLGEVAGVCATEFLSGAAPHVFRRLVSGAGARAIAGGSVTVVEVETGRVCVTHVGNDREPGEGVRAALDRRGVTIDTIGYDVISDRWLDDHGGIDDLYAGVLRCVRTSHAPDPGLPVRLWRLAVELGLPVDAEPATASSARTVLAAPSGRDSHGWGRALRFLLTLERADALALGLLASQALGADGAIFGELDVSSLRAPEVDATDTAPDARLALLVYADDASPKESERKLSQLGFVRSDRTFAIASATVARLLDATPASTDVARVLAGRFDDRHLDAARSIGVTFRRSWPTVARLSDPDVLGRLRSGPLDG